MINHVNIYIIKVSSQKHTSQTHITRFVSLIYIYISLILHLLQGCGAEFGDGGLWSKAVFYPYKAVKMRTKIRTISVWGPSLI